MWEAKKAGLRVPGQPGVHSYTVCVKSNKQTNKQKRYKPGVVAHTFNPSIQEAEAGRFLSSRPAWSTK